MTGGGGPYGSLGSATFGSVGNAGGLVCGYGGG